MQAHSQPPNRLLEMFEGVNVDVNAGGADFSPRSAQHSFAALVFGAMLTIAAQWMWGKHSQRRSDVALRQGGYAPVACQEESQSEPWLQVDDNEQI